MKSRVLKTAPELSNSSNIVEHHVQLLVEELGRLASVDTKVAAKAIRYVVDDTDSDVLLTLASLKKSGQCLRLLGIQYSAYGLSIGSVWHHVVDHMNERTVLLNMLHDLPPAPRLRLLEVCEAVGQAAGYNTQLPPGWPIWLELLIGEIVSLHRHNQQHEKAMPMEWSLDMFETILAAADLPAQLPAQMMLMDPADPSMQMLYYVSHPAMQALSGWPAYLGKHTAYVLQAVQQPTPKTRVHVLQRLRQLDYDFAPIAQPLAELCTGSSKTVRQAVQPILESCKDALRPHLESILSEGSASERFEAVSILWRLFGSDIRDVLQQHTTQEPAARVRQEIGKYLAEAHEDTPPSNSPLTLPPQVEIDTGIIDLTPEVVQGFRDYFETSYQAQTRWYEQYMEHLRAVPRSQRFYTPLKPQRIPDRVFDAFIRFAEGKDTDLDTVLTIRRHIGTDVLHTDWLAPPDVALIHVLRAAFACNDMDATWHGLLFYPLLQQIEIYRKQCSPPFGLRELNTAVATLPGIEADTLAQTYLSVDSEWGNYFDWEPETIWPLFAERQHILHAALEPVPNPSHIQDFVYRHRRVTQRHNAFRVLAMFPQLPSPFIPVLWDIALGEGKTERSMAQDAMATLPNPQKLPKIIDALGAGKQAVRETAASWLGRLGDATAIEPLKKAFRQEKQEAVKGAIMTALDTLGADVNAFLDRDALLAEAGKGLKKKRPKGSEWVPLDKLPPLHWQDSGEAVAPEIVQWWMIQSIQQKTPACGPLLRRYLAMCQPDEAAALARFVLSAWIAQDTAAMPYGKAAEEAKRESDRSWAAYSQYVHFRNQYDNRKENLYRQLLQQYTTECVGSAIGQKGILAMVAAAGDHECVKLCEEYIRKWFGRRLAQCKCLLEVLAWIEDPAALQVLLSIANRFRTTVIRQAAEEHVQALAERRGWTIEELADRTIPDAGFERPADENGEPSDNAAVLLLDYGSRQFRASLDDQLQPVITRQDGKVVKSLPAPGKQDDADKVKAAKKAFTGAKKIVKSVVKLQTERLYEALCNQRTWRFEDWQRYLAEHPIVGALCNRLVWAAFAPDTDGQSAPMTTFRPLEDGSLTNEQDEDVSFAPGTIVSLAHACRITPALGDAWLQHFGDYDVTLLFPQFGRDTYTLLEDDRQATEIRDFAGHMLTTFQLRSQATKLGFVRGEPQDGGCFFLYRKPFPSLKIQAVIEFTGSYVPEEDLTAALENLYFLPMGGREANDAWATNKLTLDKIPPVLLSECYNDIRQIAQVGTGYDPEWSTKSFAAIAEDI